MIDVAVHADGVILPVLAHARARLCAVLGERAGALRVAVTDPPEKGKANAAIQVLLAEVLSCPAQRITLVAGQTSRHKRFLVQGIALAELKRRLESIVAGADPRRPRP